MKGAHLGECEAGFQPFQNRAVDAPVDASLVVTLIVERKASLLQRGQIPPNRSGGHIEFVGEAVDRGAMSGRFQRVEHFPLTDDFLVPRPCLILPRLAACGLASGASGDRVTADVMARPARSIAWR